MVTYGHPALLMDPSEGRRVAGVKRSLIAAMLATPIAVACVEGPTQKAERTITSTITLGSEDLLAVDSAVTLVIEGERRSTEIYATLHAVVTASTSTRAEAIADTIEILVDQESDPRTVKISVPVPKDTVLQGQLELRVPADLRIEAIGRGDTVDVLGMDDDLRVASQSHVKITDAKQDVIVGVVRGNALIDVDLDLGSNIQVVCDAGDIELRVPLAISADLGALVKQSGTILPRHPQLPPYRGQPGQPYRTRIGDGLSTVSLETSVGNIVITTR
jgi:hypothetical protein